MTLVRLEPTPPWSGLKHSNTETLHSPPPPKKKQQQSYCICENWQQSLRGGGGESVEDDGRSGRLKDATVDENVKVVHTLIRQDPMKMIQAILSSKL